MLVTLPSVVMQLVCVGFPSALTYYVARHPQEWPSLSRQIVGSAFVQTGIGVIALVGLNLYFFHTRSTFVASLVVLPSLPLLIFLYYAGHLVQGLGDIRWVNLTRLGVVVFYSGGILLGALLGLTVMACAIIWTASQSVMTAIVGVNLLRRVRRHVPPQISQGELPTRKTIGRFAMAGFLAQVSPVESFRLDTLAMAVLFPSQIVGYYAVANSVTNPPLFVADALSMVGYPHVASESGRSAVNAARRYLWAGLLFCSLSALLLILALPFLIPLLFGSAYSPSVPIAELLAVAAAVMGLRRLGNDCFRALGKPGLSTRLEVVTLLILVAAMFTLGRWGDGKGVALSLIIAAGVGVGLFVRVFRRIQTMTSKRASVTRPA